MEFVALNGPCTAKRIAREINLKLSTCYHVLRTLVAAGFLSRLDDGTYDVGSRTHSYVRAVQDRFSVRPELLVALKRLHNSTRETSYVSGWNDGSLVLQHYLAGLHPLNVGPLDIGYTGDMHARAAGKAVLAHLPVEEVEAMLSGMPLRAVTENTITDFEEFQVELAQTRSQGYAIDREELLEDVHCVAAPFFTLHRIPAGAYTVSVPAERFQRNKALLIQRVIEASEMVTRFLLTGRLTSNSDSTSPAPHAPQIKFSGASTRASTDKWTQAFVAPLDNVSGISEGPTVGPPESTT